MATHDEIRALKKKHSAALLRRPGVCGVNVGIEPDGGAVLEVHVDADDPDVLRGLPECIDGHPVKYLKTGPFRKLEARANPRPAREPADGKDQPRRGRSSQSSSSTE